MKNLIRYFTITLLFLLPAFFGYVGYRIGKYIEPNEAVGIDVDLNTVKRFIPVSFASEKSNFEISIPKINLIKKVEPNIDSSDSNSYEGVLNSKIAHAKYSLLPDQLTLVNGGVVYLFGHREGDAGFFNRLDELETGDTISINYNSSSYIFVVSRKYIVDPSDTTFMFESNGQKILRIQTCEDGQKSRLIVDAVLVGKD